MPCIFILIAAFSVSCSSTGGSAAPESSNLTGTWKYEAGDSSTQVLLFNPEGTGTFTAYAPDGQPVKTVPLTYSPQDDTRFGIVGETWVTFVPCEISGRQLTLKNSAQVFEKQ